MIHKLKRFRYLRNKEEVVQAYFGDSIIVEANSGLVLTPRAWGELYCRLTRKYRSKYRRNQYIILHNEVYNTYTKGQYLERIPIDAVKRLISIESIGNIHVKDR